MRFRTLLSCIVGLIIHVTPSSGQPLYWLTTVGGGGEGENQPASGIGLRANSIAIDSKGNIYVADHYSNIKKIDAETGLVSLLTISTSTIVFLCIDQNDNLFIADRQHNTVVKYSLTTSTLTSIAGTGENGFAGDGAPAVDAKLSSPNGVMVDANGEIYIIDGGNNRIRKIDSNGVITTVAGNGTSGFSGDGGQATSAQLNSPMALAKDADNNLYIADYLNNRLRKVDLTSGVITTIAGFGPGTYNGENMTGVNTTLHGPAGLHFDGSNFLYFSDRFNRRIRKIDLTTNIVSLVAGNGDDRIAGDGGLAVDASLVTPGSLGADKNNNLYVGDDWEYGSNGVIRKISLTSGVITTIAGNNGRKFCCEGVAAKQAQFANISGMAIDKDGNIFIADIDQARVRKINKQAIVTTVAGSGLFFSSGPDATDPLQLKLRPYDVKSDKNGNLYISDQSKLRKLTPDNNITTIAGGATPGTTGDGGLAVNALLENAHGLHIDEDGNIYIAQTYKVRKIDGSTGIITTIAGGGTGGDGGLATDAQLSTVQDIAVDSKGNLFIGELTRIRKVDAETGIIATIAGNESAGFSGDGGLAESAQLSMVSALAVDRNNSIYIGDAARVRKITSDGLINTIAGDGNYGGTTSDFFSTMVPIGRTAALVLDDDDNLLIGSFNLVKKLHQNKLQQTITFDPIPAKTYGNAPFQIAATASSGMEITFTSSNLNVATVSGNEIIIVGAGTTTITAHQAGDFVYEESVADQTLIVSKADQLITFNGLPDKTFGDPAFTLGATASSGLPVTYSTTSAKVTVTSNVVTLNEPGRVTITASEEGNQNYNASVSVVQSFCINPAKPIITRTEGFPIILTSSSQVGNQWYRDTEALEDAVLNTLEVSETGAYTVTTSVDGCLSEVSDKADVLIVGTEEISRERIDIYPNPVSETIMTNIPYTPNATIEIIDVRGNRQDCEIRIENDAIAINAMHMAPGLYLLRIQSGQVSAIAKVIKK